MTRTVFVNGDYLPEAEAKVSVFDRGFLMADGVYEVTSVLDGKLIDFDGHIRRLERSLNELEMSCPVSAIHLSASSGPLDTKTLSTSGFCEGLMPPFDTTTIRTLCRVATVSASDFTGQASASTQIRNGSTGASMPERGANRAPRQQGCAEQRRRV